MADSAAALPWTPELAAELGAMHADDQAVREGLGPETLADTAFLGRMARTDSAHSRRLGALVERHGWPLVSEVGEEAAEGAFLVVQHTPFDDWQRTMLPLVEAAVRAGELDAQDFALLYDRVQVRQGRPQRYGTQLQSGPDGRLHPDPLEDSASVDSLRAELGLPPLDVYFDLVEEITGMTVERGVGG